MTTESAAVRDQADGDDTPGPIAEPASAGTSDSDSLMTRCHCDAGSLFKQFQELFRNLDQAHAHAADCPYGHE